MCEHQLNQFNLRKWFNQMTNLNFKYCETGSKQTDIANGQYRPYRRTIKRTYSVFKCYLVLFIFFDVFSYNRIVARETTIDENGKW